MLKLDFFIVGAQKSGTTSIFNYLKHQEAIFMAEQNELQIFSRDHMYKRREEYLNTYFKDCADHTKKGIKDVRLMYNAEVCSKRLYEHNPNAKIVMILRNPLKRAYSSYWFTKMKGFEYAETFEEAIDREEDRLSTLAQEELIEKTYLNVGKYYNQVKNYLNIFEKNNVKILILEEFLQNKKEAFRNLIEYLGCDKGNIDYEILGEKYNSSTKYKFKTINKLIKSKDNISFIHKIIPLGLKKYFRNTVIKKIKDLNEDDFSYPEINDRTYQSLQNYYEYDIRKLSELIGKDLLQIWGIKKF
jgi:hypothetical protein